MRKVIVQQWISADGYAADANGSTKFFEDPKWGVQSDEDLFAQMDQMDTILLGATTYKMFADFWPYADPRQEIIANRLNETPKIVFSNTLETVAWGKWEPPVLKRGRAEDAVKNLKQKKGKDLVLWGSISLMQSLISAGLIDELHLRTLPLLLGDGRHLFGRSQLVALETIEVKKYASGLIFTRFKVGG